MPCLIPSHTSPFLTSLPPPVPIPPMPIHPLFLFLPWASCISPLIMNIPDAISISIPSSTSSTLPVPWFSPSLPPPFSALLSTGHHPPLPLNTWYWNSIHPTWVYCFPLNFHLLTLPVFLLLIRFLFIQTWLAWNSVKSFGWWLPVLKVKGGQNQT